MDHKEKLEEAKRLYETANADQKYVLESLFPELRESEDERIRKWLIKEMGRRLSCWTSTEVTKEQVLAWLEKQGKSIDINPSEFDLRLNKLLKQFETLPKEELASSLSFYLNVVQNDGTCKDEEKQYEQKLHIEKLPFEMKTPEESLGIDSDTYSKIVDELIYGEPKQEWSEEDEQFFLVCKNALAKYQTTDKWDACIISHWLEDKLKSLRPKNTWKPTEEQIETLKCACGGNYVNLGILESLYNDLKKLKGE